jgi:hypothetical protein
MPARVVRLFCFGFVCAWAGAAALCATAETSTAGAADPAAATKARIEAAYAANLAAYTNNADVWVRPGLVADRRARTVTLDAESTGVKAGETAEFFLIGRESGHAYEALAVSDAAPGDVRKALEFIGLRAGEPYDPAKLRFWPKGERVRMTFSFRNAAGSNCTAHAAGLILDKRTQKPLRDTGFVFAGSLPVDDPSHPGSRALAADLRDPRSIACNYNEQETILDVPRQAVQGEVYDNQCVGPDWTATSGTPVSVRLTPEFADGRTRVVEMALQAQTAVSTGAVGLADVQMTLTAGTNSLCRQAGLNAVLEALTKIVSAGQDPFVTVDMDGALTVGSARALCQVLSSIETETGIRVEPPPAGRLYYRAFIPNEQFRRREARIAQPWELRLRQNAGKVDAVVTAIEQVWTQDKLQPDLKVASTPLDSPEAVLAHLKANDGLPVVLVFADPDLRLSDLRRFVAPLLPTHPTIHVYTGEPL